RDCRAAPTRGAAVGRLFPFAGGLGAREGRRTRHEIRADRGHGRTARRGPRCAGRPPQCRRRHRHRRSVPTAVAASSSRRAVVDAGAVRQPPRRRRSARLRARGGGTARALELSRQARGRVGRPRHRDRAREQLSRLVYAPRLARARARMADLGIDVMLLSIGPDLPYLTGYEAMPLERLTMLVVPDGADAVLLVPRLEAPRVVEHADAFRLEVWDETEDSVGKVVAYAGAARRAAIGDHTWARFVLALQC